MLARPAAGTVLVLIRTGAARKLPLFSRISPDDMVVRLTPPLTTGADLGLSTLLPFQPPSTLLFPMRRA